MTLNHRFNRKCHRWPTPLDEIDHHEPILRILLPEALAHEPSLQQKMPLLATPLDEIDHHEPIRRILLPEALAPGALNLVIRYDIETGSQILSQYIIIGHSTFMSSIKCSYEKV
jgi:hypothetical protein